MRAAVVGLGSELHGDDAVGGAVVRRLRERGVPRGVDLLEAGAGAHVLLDLIGGYDRVILVDCARMGLEPGAVRAFDAASVRDRRQGGRVGGHDPAPLAAAGLAGSLGCPWRLTVVGVEPASTEAGASLSEPVAAAVDPAADLVLRALGARERDGSNHG